jgi:hypothetical protein
MFTSVHQLWNGAANRIDLTELQLQNLALTDKTSCRLQSSNKITYFNVVVEKKST